MHDSTATISGRVAEASERASEFMSMPQDDEETEDGTLWVFGFGSLMWRPGFSYTQMQAAALDGYRRDMCFLSIHYRGTPQVPGLVCGLVKADQPRVVCKGRAFCVHKSDEAKVVAYLDKRELITDIYHPTRVHIRLTDGRYVNARTYLSDTSHDQFVGNWPDENKAAAIAAGVGSEGSSLEYLENIVHHLKGLDITDVYMEKLLTKARLCKSGKALQEHKY